MELNAFSHWRFDDVISDDDINYILSLPKDQWTRGKVNLKGSVKPSVRDSNIVWTEDQRIYDLIWPFMVTANEQLTHFDIDAAETMQITQYQENQYYDYHIDGLGISYYDRPPGNIRHKRTRKLSMSLVLNDDFEGGQLQFYNEDPIENKKGMMIFFPSYLSHRVRPVTKGVRYSLVTWFIGPPFK
jgi:PKHD-type hydroxylase